jgi:hypothetical protein
MLAIEDHDAVLVHPACRRLQHGVALKVTVQVEHFLVHQVSRLEADVLLVFIIAVENLNRKRCIEIPPSSRWARVNRTGEFVEARFNYGLAVRLVDNNLLADTF